MDSKKSAKSGTGRTRTAKSKIALLPGVGSSVFIRTVTHHYTGRVVAVSDGFVALDEAAWIADDGRFSEAMLTGTLSEIEPYPDGRIVRVGVGSFVDWTDWPFTLPRTCK